MQKCTPFCASASKELIWGTSAGEMFKRLKSMRLTPWWQPLQSQRIEIKALQRRMFSIRRYISILPPLSDCRSIHKATKSDSYFQFHSRRSENDSHVLGVKKVILVLILYEWSLWALCSIHVSVSPFMLACPQSCIFQCDFGARHWCNFWCDFDATLLSMDQPWP